RGGVRDRGGIRHIGALQCERPRRVAVRSFNGWRDRRRRRAPDRAEGAGVRPERRVVVTGVGVVSALGTGYPAHTQGLREGRCGTAPLARCDTGRPMVRTAAEPKQFEGEHHFARNELALLDRTSQMALVAAKEAIGEAGIDFEGELGPRTATIIGTAMGGLQTLDENYHAVYGEMKSRVHPF